jgi:hypothetical protein
VDTGAVNSRHNKTNKADRNIVARDDRELRMNFLIHLLKYHENEAKDNIPNILRQYLRSIKK